MKKAMTIAAALAVVGCGSDPSTESDSVLQGTYNDSVCIDQTHTLFAGQTMDAGDVSITNDGTNIYVDIATDGTWRVEDAAVYVGTSPVPVNRGGNPVIGAFPYKQAYSPAATSASFVIPLANLDVECGSALFIGVHANVGQAGTNGRISNRQTAFAYEEGNEFGGSRWGWYLDYDVCCDDGEGGSGGGGSGGSGGTGGGEGGTGGTGGGTGGTGGETGCVYKPWQWAGTVTWPVNSLTVGTTEYTPSDLAYILNNTLWGTDISVRLAYFYAGARLNEASGAPVPMNVQEALADADIWFATYADADGQLPYDVVLGEAGFSTADTLFRIFGSYSEGDQGVPTCL